MPRIRRVANDDSESLVPFDIVHGGGFVSEGGGIEDETVGKILGRFEAVRQIDSDAVGGRVELVLGIKTGGGQLRPTFKWAMT